MTLINKRLGIYGISGVGKTSILNALEEKKGKYIIYHGSKNLLKIADCDNTQFKKMSEENKNECRKLFIKAAESLQKKEGKHIIVDGHYSFYTSAKEFDEVMGISDKKFYTDIVYLDIASKEIMKRCNNDKGKRRQIYTEREITEWKNFEIKKLKKCCKEYNSNFYLVNEKDTYRIMEYIINIIEGEHHESL